MKKLQFSHKLLSHIENLKLNSISELKFYDIFIECQSHVLNGKK